MDQILAVSDNVVLMKVYKNYHQLVQKLKQHGLADNAVMISRCGLDDEKVIEDLETAGEQGVNYLSTILASRNK